MTVHPRESHRAMTWHGKANFVDALSSVLCPSAVFRVQGVLLENIGPAPLWPVSLGTLLQRQRKGQIGSLYLPWSSVMNSINNGFLRIYKRVTPVCVLLRDSCPPRKWKYRQMTLIKCGMHPKNKAESHVSKEKWGGTIGTNIESSLEHTEFQTGYRRVGKIWVRRKDRRMTF